MEGFSGSESKLEKFLLQSQFKKQVDSLGPDVFSLLLDMYQEGNLDENIKNMFPKEKKRQFDEIAEELSGKNLAYRKDLYDYLMNAKNSRLKDIFGDAYDSVISMKNSLMSKFGKSEYDSIYKNFINAQFEDSLLEAEGDTFFYIGKRRFTPKDKDEELIWIFGKVIELLYGVNNG
jgi:hypothetical protein